MTGTPEVHRPDAPSWTRHVLWWQIYPLGFVGAPIRPEPGREIPVEHRLSRIEAWLDHLVELGLNGLQLGPVFASSSHGYDTTDYFRIDPRLGDENDFADLVEAAHSRGIRVLLDGVFNHVARSHPWFTEVERQGPDSAHANLFRIDWSGWSAGDPVRADVFEGHDHLVTLNHNSREVENLVVDVMKHWLASGADGWRLDAAYAVAPAFWANVLARVRQAHPDAWFTAEVLQGDQKQFVLESAVDSVTQYELWQGIWHGITDRNFYELAHAIDRNNSMLDSFVPSTFVGNHDVTRIASAISDPRHLPHALAVLFTLSGVPAVYAGDEYALHGVKEQRLGGDDAVRPAFPAQPNGAHSLGAEASVVHQTHEALISLRRQHPWLHEAKTEVLELENEFVLLRASSSKTSVYTALNLADTTRLSNAPGDLVVRAGSARVADPEIEIPGHGWAVLTLEG